VRREKGEVISIPMMTKVASLFFFSSRRRHTRWPRDWSSDVCSSDLVHADQDASLPSGPTKLKIALPTAFAQQKNPDRRSILRHRSEERRVGKECRSRWSLSHVKIKSDNNTAAAMRCKHSANNG